MGIDLTLSSFHKCVLNRSGKTKHTRRFHHTIFLSFDEQNSTLHLCAILFCLAQDGLDSCIRRFGLLPSENHLPTSSNFSWFLDCKLEVSKIISLTCKRYNDLGFHELRNFVNVLSVSLNKPVMKRPCGYTNASEQISHPYDCIIASQHSIDEHLTSISHTRSDLFRECACHSIKSCVCEFPPCDFFHSCCHILFFICGNDFIRT